MTTSGEYYDAIAPGYVRLHKQEQMEKLRDVAARLEVRPSDRVLSVGCGPCFALDVWPVPEKCAEMVGLDPSAALIAQARARGITRAVVCRAEDMLEHADELLGGPLATTPLFDVVISLTAAQNFDDVDRALASIAALGRDRFCITWLKRAAKGPALDAAMQRIFDVTLRLEQQFDIITFATKKKPQ